MLYDPIQQPKGVLMADHGMLFGERRHHPRKSCSRLVDINDYRSLYKGHLRNLTAAGAFIEPTSKISVQIDQELTLTIPYGLKKKTMTVKAKVAWITNQGIGIRFLNADMY
jgi:Tfp pilus assembly protein PilZ